MSRASSVNTPPRPLPNVPGPKLAPCTSTSHAHIDFVRLLSHSKNQDGHVWEVIIDGKTFSLKMAYLATSPDKYLTDPLAIDQACVDYFDTFNCECRAYGRLQQEGRQDLAVQAHGYLLLTADQERTITAEIDPDSLQQKTPPVSPCLDGDGPWGRYEQHRGQLLRAIAKDIAEDNDSFTAAQVPQLWTDLKALHSIGILVRDIHMGNYMDGKLVDLSLAWTMYHPSLDRIDDYDIYTLMRAELIDLEQMMYDWWYMNPALEIKIPRELSCFTVGATAGQIGIDPRKYDWPKWENKPAMVATYIAKELFEPDEDC